MPESKETARDLPLVSVVMPAYNHERFVEEAVRSVWAQTYPHVELIVLNDGSPDRTGEILDRLQADSPIPMRVVHKENEGVCKTLNRGVDLAQGSYLALLASDDLIHPEKVAREVACLEVHDEDVAGCYGDVKMIGEDGRELYVQPIKLRDGRDDLFFSLLMDARPAYLQAHLFHTEDFRKVGRFDESLGFEDLDFMLRLTRDYKLAYAGGISVYYRQVEGSLDKKIWDFDDDFITILDKYIGDERMRELGRYGFRKVRGRMFLRLSYVKFLAGQRGRTTWRYLLGSIKEWPFDFRVWGMVGLLTLPQCVSRLLVEARRKILFTLQQRLVAQQDTTGWD